MIEFASAPDPVFLAILREALDHVGNDLYPWVPGVEPTQEDLANVEDFYSQMYPELTRFFSRTEALAVVRRLRFALDDDKLYRITDFHWRLLYVCLQMFSDLHNDGALGTDGHVGPYIVDRIDLSEVIERFFFDTDFAFGPEFLIARERNPFPVSGVSAQAFKIAAGVKPDAADLELTSIDPSQSGTESDEDNGQLPTSGYVGPYPMREPASDQER